MSSASSIAASALYATALRQAFISNNVANAYKPDYKASSVQTTENQGGGVTASVSQGNDTVDISREAVNMLSNVNDYKANVKTIQTSDQMTQRLLSILG